MAFVFSSSSPSLFLTIKVSFFSVSIISIAMILKLYFLVLCEYLLFQLPQLWASLRAWLTPPYLYVVINFIIITIAASSRFQHKVDEEIETIVIPEPVKLQPETMEFPREVYEEQPEELKVQVEEAPVNLKVDNKAVEGESKDGVQQIEAEAEDQIVLSNAKEIPKWRESMEISSRKEKPPVSVRFGHRKIAKGATEGGKSLKVTKPKRQETLESTWKMITEGRSMPLARHLKKSETLETHSQSVLHHEPQVKKSETFNDRNNVSSALTRSQGSGKLKKEPSLSQDDLNRRVEAFINKFNEEMRLQRLESLNRYQEMMVRDSL